MDAKPLDHGLGCFGGLTFVMVCGRLELAPGLKARGRENLAPSTRLMDMSATRVSASKLGVHPPHLAN